MSHLFKDILFNDNKPETSDFRNYRSNFILQSLCDSISAAKNTPLRIMDFAQLSKLPDIAISLLSDDKLKQLLNESSESENIINGFGLYHEVVFTKNDIKEFIDIFILSVNKLFEGVRHTIYKQDLAGNNSGGLTDDDLYNVELEIDKYIQRNYASTLFNKNINGKLLNILRYLIPHIEKEIWKTDNSYSYPVHMLMRMEPTWRMYILFWLYKNKNTIATNIKKSEKYELSTIDKVFNISSLYITFFELPSEGSHVCFMGPFLNPGSTHSNFHLFIDSAIYLKHCFISFVKMLADDANDMPGIEEINAALIRRYTHTRNQQNHLCQVVADAWKLLLTVEFAEKKFSDVFNRKDISSLGNWVTFVSEYWIDLWSNEEYLEILKVPSPNQDEKISKFKIRTIIYPHPHTKITIRIEGNVDSKPESRLVQMDRQYDYPYFYTNSSFSTSNITKLPRKYFGFLERITARTRNYQSSSVEVLGEWLQRHFGSDISEYSSGNIYSQISSYACHTLSELTRADICTTIYKIDYKHKLPRAVIVGDYSQNINILASTELRQNELDSILKINGDMAYKYSLVYKSIKEDRFIYSNKLDSNSAAIQSYPDPKPYSAIVMPLHMEHRILGVIEVKGSQISHFGWSQRLLFQQICSVLAPYFYRQQVIQSLTQFSRYVLAEREAAFNPGNGNNMPTLGFENICGELCNIFLCNTAQLWLRDQDHLDKYILRGSSNSNIFESVVNDKNGNVVSIDVSSNQDRNSELTPLVSRLHFHPGFPLKSKIKNEFIVGKYDPYIQVSVFDNKDLLTLGSNFVKVDNTGLRKYLFEEETNREVMVFSLFVNQFQSNEVLGFVSLYNNKFFDYSKNWRNTIALVNEQLVIALQHLQIYFDEVNSQKLMIQHEIRAQAIQLNNHIENYSSRIGFIKSKLQPLSNNLLKYIKKNEPNNELKSIIFELSEIITANNYALKSYEDATEAYPGLLELLDKFYENKTIKNICQYDEEANIDKIYLRNFILEILIAYRHKYYDKGVYIDNTIAHEIYWEIYSKPLRRIMINLIDNAVKYCSDNSQIIINGDYGRFSINNKSQYDPNLDIEAVFNLGVRGKKTQNNEGVGYGLFLVKECCKLLNMKINYRQEQITNTPDLANHIIEISFGD